MSLSSLPIETITHIFNLLDESKPETSFDINKHRDVSEILMALRLTCKELNGIATAQLFCRLYLPASRDFWLKICTLAANQRLCVHLQILALDIEYDWATFGLNLWEAYKSHEIYVLDISSFPSLKELKAGNRWLIRKKLRSNVQIPRENCKLYLPWFYNYEPASWSLLDGLRKITSYDFDFRSLRCELREDH